MLSREVDGSTYVNGFHRSGGTLPCPQTRPCRGLQHRGPRVALSQHAIGTVVDVHASCPIRDSAGACHLDRPVPSSSYAV